MTQNHTRIEQILLATAGKYPHAIALTEWRGDDWAEISYVDLVSRAKNFSQLLLDHQVRPGERIIVMSHNRIEAVIALFGIWLSSATAVLIDPDLPEAACLQQCEIADARTIILEKEKSPLPKNISLTIMIDQNNFIFQKSQCEISKTVDDDCDKNIATLIFTSGTTGVYKAVMLTHNNYLYLTKFYSNLSSQNGCSLTVLPMFHVAGLYCGILQPLFLGVHVVFFRVFSADALQESFVKYHPTVLITVPRLLEVLNQKIAQAVSAQGFLSKILFYCFISLSYFFHRYFYLSLSKIFFKKIHDKFGGKLKKILCGSAPLSSHLQKQFLSYGFDMYASYGLTETCGPITFTQFYDRWKSGSVGPCVEKKDLKISEAGEILYCGAALMRGYFRDEIATQEAMRDGYFHTRDLGKMDHHGNLYIIGRIKELIIFSDGKKIMPEQMEMPYQKISGIKEYAIAGVNDHGIQLAVLFFVPQDNEDSKKITQALFHFASTLKSPYRISDVMLVEKIPRSSTLKVKRHLLEEIFLSQKKNSYEKHSIQSAALQDLIDCFQSILPNKKELITADVSFAQLGIDSLLAAQLSQAISEKLHISLNPTAFWFATSIRSLHTYLQAEQKAMPQKSLEKKQYEKIAIVAMQGVFPEADDVDQFWKNCIAKKDCITKVPSSRFNIDDYYDAYALAPGKTNSNCGGFISFPENFPAEKFGLKPRVALAMDPQQKILLLQVEKLLKNFSGDEKSFQHSNTGFFLGAGFPDYMMQLMRTLPLEKVTSYSGTGMADFSLVGRVAYHFGLEGPAMMIKTACSSSLIAVHQAARALQCGDCDIAIAGGINVILIPEINVCLTKGGFLSPDGRCKSFDASANGYVRSETCALVLLKRYEDAVRDNNKILGVIAGSAINQDGASNGLTAPSGHAQIKCYQDALRFAHVEPHQVYFLESHGSGTQLGDAIEMQSIQGVYDHVREKNNPLYVGAVKSNIGHCEASAGIAGLIKTLLVLQHQMIPANLHYKTPNPNISFENSNVILPQENISVKNKNGFVAVSSFGVAGTNGHVILSHH